MEQVADYPRSDTTSLSATSQDGRRRELASFLRSRLESLAPEAVGMPRKARRRVRGLRREEVAEAAANSSLVGKKSPDVRWHTFAVTLPEMSMTFAGSFWFLT